jgi:hypothetical protein
MEEREMMEVIIFLAGATITVCLAVFGVWFKLHHRQETKLETLQITNGKEHRDLHDKIDANHHALRDRLDKIWQHMRIS